MLNRLQTGGPSKSTILGTNQQPPPSLFHSAKKKYFDFEQIADGGTLGLSAWWLGGNDMHQEGAWSWPRLKILFSLLPFGCTNQDVEMRNGNTQYLCPQFMDLVLRNSNEKVYGHGQSLFCGQPFGYTNWVEGEPDDSNGLEDCIAIDRC